MLAACGYYTVGGGLPSHIRTVGVDFFENATVETGLEARLARALSDEVVGRAQFRYASARISDALVRGRIVSAVDEPLAYTAGQVTEYQIVVTVEAEVWDREKGRALWEHDAVRGRGTYDPAAGLQAREAAFATATGEVAKFVIDGLTSGW